ncbi:MAG: hypothetical protein NC182_01075 [Prevotella sp.]|nr:hypothetical protein [Staphylococcus sp.]MCM1349775.1 hypothetical protein [Prevotella sp.]
MKKIFLTIALCFGLFAFTGCVEKYPIPIGIRPSQRFSVAEYIGNDAVYQENTPLKISGKAEPGVVMVATLTDVKSSIVDTSFATTDNNGVWSLSLDAPDGSLKAYHLKIADSLDTYHEFYTNIRFGEVWFVTGDAILDSTENETGAKENIKDKVDYNKMFLYQNKWVPATPKISLFASNLLDQIEKDVVYRLKKAIAVVLATTESTTPIYSWFSSEMIQSRNYLSSFLEKNGLSYQPELVTTPTWAYQKYIALLTGMNFNAIIWNQGIYDFSTPIDTGGQSFEKIYSQMFYDLMSDFQTRFPFTKKIMVLQEGSNFITGSERLRKVQSDICKYYNRCILVPTYDLNHIVNQSTEDEILTDDIITTEDWVEKVDGYNTEQLIKRVFKLLKNENELPMLNNVLQIYNSDKKVTHLKLIFNFEFTGQTQDSIEGLVFYDKDLKPVDVKYRLVNNEIIIELETIKYVPNETDVAESLTYETVAEYQQIYKIAYAQSDFIYHSNLKLNGIAVVPFEVWIEN